MSKKQHTKGPWSFDGEGLIASESDPSGRTICRAHYADAARIVACVNACEGMDDPAAEIERLREGHKAAALMLLENDRRKAVDWAAGLSVHLPKEGEAALGVRALADVQAERDEALALLTEVWCDRDDSDQMRLIEQCLQKHGRLE